MMDIFALFVSKRALVAIFLKNTQLPEGATRVTPQWRGTPEAFTLKKDRSRSWRRKLRASAEVLNGFFWAAQWNVSVEGFGYLVIAVSRVTHGDSQKVPRRYVTQLGWMSPAKKLAVWCDYCYLWDSEFCIFTTSVGRISHYRRDSESVYETFFSTLFSVLAHCMSWHEPLHVTVTTYGSKRCQAVFWPLVTFHIMRSSSWRIQGCQNGCGEKRWPPLVGYATMCHEHPWDRFKFKSGSWPIHRSHFSIFMTPALVQLIYYFVCLDFLFLTISQMLDLREKLGVTIQHLIGPNNEQMLLGCGDSTKVHPKVTKPLWKAKMAIFLYILKQHVLSWHIEVFADAAVSFDVLF